MSIEYRDNAQKDLRFTYMLKDLQITFIPNDCNQGKLMRSLVYNVIYNIRASICLNIATGLFRLRPRSVHKIASLFLIRQARVTRKINKIKQIREHRASCNNIGCVYLSFYFELLQCTL